MMAAYILKPTAEREEKDSWLMQRYMRTMRWCLQHRLLTTAVAALFFAASIALVGLLPTGFVPAADRGQTQVNIELSPRQHAARDQQHCRAGQAGGNAGQGHHRRLQLDRRRLQRR